MVRKLKITKEITLDVSRLNRFQSIIAKQNDKDSRYLKVSIADEGNVLIIPSSAKVTITATRPDKLSSSFLGKISEDGKAIVPLSPWMLELDGSLSCEVSIITEESVLKTTSFFVDVEPDEASGNTDVTQDPNYDILVELIQEVAGVAAIEKEAISIAVDAYLHEKNIRPLQKGTDFWTEEDKAEINADNIAFITTELAKRGQLKPEFANSVEECTDSSKLYVLPDGYIYAYMDKEITTLATNKLDRSKIFLNTRYSGSPGSAVTADGHYTSDFIPVDMSLADPLVMRISPASAIKAPNGGCKIILIGADKVTLQQTYLFNDSTQNTGSTVHNAITSDGDYLIDIGYVRTGTNTPTKYANYDEIKYIRITDELGSSSITLDNVPEYTITFDAENKTEHVMGWASTGHAFVPADYEDRLIDIEEDVAAIKKSILEKESGTDGGTESTEITVPAYWQSAIDSCVAKIKALQVGKHCVTFPFFSDNHTNIKDLGVLIAKVMKECNIPYCLFGGDAIDSGYLNENQMIEQDKAFDDVMSQIPNGRFCRAIGNHDGFWNDNGTKGYYTRAKVYELFLREEGMAQNKHFGEDGTYYYVDEIASKVRFIVLNTNSEAISAGGESIDNTQLSWLQDTALSFNEDGWGVVIISHCPISNHYHANVTNAAEVISAVNSADVDIIGWFSGHIHRDRMYTHLAVGSSDGVEGTNGAALGFTQVVITSDHTSISYDDATKHTVANDNQSHAIDFVTINRNTRTVNITRLGIGSDRSYTY